jgi:hypothetical protein
MKKIGRSQKWLRENRAETYWESLEKLDLLSVDDVARKLGICNNSAYWLLSSLRVPLQEQLAKLRS